VLLLRRAGHGRRRVRRSEIDPELVAHRSAPLALGRLRRALCRSFAR
jgi:hypothetical protein